MFEQTRVTEIVFKEGRDPVRSDNPLPMGVNYVQKDGRSGHITFDYLVDASGTKGLMSTKVCLLNGYRCLVPDIRSSISETER